MDPQQFINGMFAFGVDSIKFCNPNMIRFVPVDIDSIQLSGRSASVPNEQVAVSSQVSIENNNVKAEVNVYDKDVALKKVPQIASRIAAGNKNVEDTLLSKLTSSIEHGANNISVDLVKNESSKTITSYKDNVAHEKVNDVTSRTKDKHPVFDVKENEQIMKTEQPKAPDKAKGTKVINSKKEKK